MKNASIKVRVSNTLIADAKYESEEAVPYSSFCPVARAIKEQLFGDLEGLVNVQFETCEINRGYGEEFYALSRAAKKFILAFDAGQKVKPATFIFKRIK